MHSLNLVIEFAKRTMRAITYLSCHLFFSLSVVLMSVIGLLTTPTFGWRWFLVVSAAPLVLSAVLTFVCPQPTRFDADTELYSYATPHVSSKH